MSLNLYQEAITEAKQLREMAEQNAKNKIIEAVTPKIRSLIEQQLMDDIEDEESELVIGDEDIEGMADAVVDVVDLTDVSPEPAAPVSDSGDQSKVSITVQGDLQMSLGEDDEEDDDLILGQELNHESYLRLESFLYNFSKTQKFSGRVANLAKRFRMLREAIDGVNLHKCTPIERQTAIIFYGRLLEEAIILSSNLILMKESVDKRLKLQLTQLIKEMSKMSKRRDAAAFRRLFEELTKDEGLEEAGMYEQEDDLDLGVEDEGGEEDEAVEGEADLGAAEDAILDLGAALGLDVEVAPEGEEDEEGDEGDEGGDEAEIELETQFYGEGDDSDDEEVLEIDESAIRRELRRMRRLREQDVGLAAQADPSLNHGGEDEGDLVVDVSEDDLLNALADELGDPGVPTPQVEAAIRRRLRRASRKLAESQRRNRRSRSRGRANARRPRTASTNRRAVVAESNVKKLKAQLNEMNLFNAKLLFANKLMQNRALSTKQQRVIVEALDKARTIREAKLLYKSLSSSLNRGSGKTLSESRSRLLSSSSRSTRSGSPAKSGVEVDRWAVLAGLSSDEN